MHEAEQLTAVVQETTFRNEDNGYTVLRVGSGRSQQTVVGVMPELSPGENVTFEGYWTEHPVYGRQFNARACAITPPTGKSAIEKYLGSGLIRGFGQATAKLIVNRFGEKALDILDEQPQRLTELPGIGPKKAAMIAESYLQQMGMRRALVFLQNYGISPTLAMRIAKYYGEDTVELVRENPYRMVMDVEGVGFLTADRMALSLGIGLQNIPEGAAVSLPLTQSGRTRGQSFAAGAASGLVEPLGAVLAFVLAEWVGAALPWLMSAAAGCMACVTAQEMIPEAVEPDEVAGVISIVLGFALMMALDVAL